MKPIIINLKNPFKRTSKSFIEGGYTKQFNEVIAENQKGEVVLDPLAGNGSGEYKVVKSKESL